MLQRSLLLLTALMLAACGGGGGGGGNPVQNPPPPAPPPPPPPSTNQPPVVAFSVSSTELNEGETFLIDVRGSSDPDGTIVAYTAEHFQPYFPELRAVRVNEGAHPDGVFEFLVPEVFEDMDVVFDITVEDDRGATTSDSAFLIFRTTVTLPKIDGFGDAYRVVDAGRPLRLLGADGLGDNVFAEDLTTQQITVVTNMQEFISNRHVQTDATVTGSVGSVTSLIPSALGFNLTPVTPVSFLAINEAANSLDWYADFEPGFPDQFELQDSVSIASPCHFAPRYSTGQDFIWVGQRGAGLSVVRMDRFVPTDLPDGTPNSHWARGFDDSLISQAGGSRSLCHVYPAVLPDRLSNRFPQSGIEDVIAVDFETNELVLFADDTGNDSTYELVEVVPLQTDGIPNLEIIDVISVGNPAFFPQFLLVLMTDGQDNGEHRLVTVYPDQLTNELMQSVHTWEGDAPTAMINGFNVFGFSERSPDYGVDVVILTTGSDAVILEDGAAEMGIPLGPPVFKPAQYLNVGEGADSVISVLAPVEGAFPRLGLLFSFPATNELKLWVYRD